ncbi:hypothetical protein C9J85_02600 [Haloferax sp. wsp5]|nr:hypothetical protein C9J85_02600 [Haloferax sp. wsp5]
MTAEERVADEPTGDVSQPGGLGVRLRALWRALVIVWQFVPLLWQWGRVRSGPPFGRSRSVAPETRTRRARYLKDTFVDLGPASLNSDRCSRLGRRPATGVSTSLELRHVPRRVGDHRALIERELGDDIDTRSRHSTRQPFREPRWARCTMHRSRPLVVVKVLRPDIGTSRRIRPARAVDAAARAHLRRGPGPGITLENLTEAFATTVRREMDYGHEARMLREFGDNLAYDDDIAIPDVVGSHSTDRVLTMTYLDGVKIDDESGWTNSASTGRPRPAAQEATPDRRGRPQPR